MTNPMASSSRLPLLARQLAPAATSPAALRLLHVRRRARPTALHPTHAGHLHSLSTRRAAHFDSHAFVERLEAQGLAREQAEGLMLALEEVIEESMKGLVAGLVTRAEMEKQQYTQKVDFAKLKSEIQLVEKQDFALLKAENERLLSELEKLKQRLREEITRTQASVRLDLNLEKGRIRDEMGVRELKIREVDTRIEGEIGNLKTNMESVKFNILQYIVGTAASSGALLLAYMRMFM